MQEIRKKFNFDLRSGDDIFLKISETFLQNLQVYKAQVMVSNFKTQVSVSDFFMKCRFRYKSLIQVVVSTTSLLKTNRDLFLSTWDRVSQKVFSRLRNGTLDHFETEVIKVTFFYSYSCSKKCDCSTCSGTHRKFTLWLLFTLRRLENNVGYILPLPIWTSYGMDLVLASS